MFSTCLHTTKDYFGPAGAGHVGGVEQEAAATATLLLLKLLLCVQNGNKAVFNQQWGKSMFRLLRVNESHTQELRRGQSFC